MKKQKSVSHIARIAVIVMIAVAALLASGLCVSCEMVPPEQIDGPAPHSNPDDPENPAYVNPETYTVTYDAGIDLTSGSAPVDETEYEEGDTVTILDNVDMVADGWTFVGWYFEDEPAEIYYGEDTFIMPAEDVTLYGYWTQEATYHVAYDGNGGNGAPQDANNYLAGAEASVLGPGTMTRDGYIFVYWECDELVEGEEYTEGELFVMPAQNITFTAVWVPDIVRLTEPGTTSAYDAFGWAVAIDGDYVVVGAPTLTDNAGVDRFGRAFVFHRTGLNTWDGGFELSTGGTEPDAQFGYSVAILGNLVLVGAPSKDDGGKTNCGVVYAFIRTGSGTAPNVWSEGAMLGYGEFDNDNFGTAVALGAGSDAKYHAVIGAPGNHDAGNTNAGSAYSYYSTNGVNWTGFTQLMPTMVENAFFGKSVAMDGNNLIVGAPGDQGFNAILSGAVYIYENTGDNSWGSAAKIFYNNATAGENFGTSVDIDGIFAVIGAPAYNSYIGRAFTFRKPSATWEYYQVLSETGDGTTDYYGQSVAIDGNYLIICAPDYTTGIAANSGVGFLYEADSGWVDRAEIAPSTLSMNNFLGCSSDISGNYIVMGAYGADNAFTDTGSVYIQYSHDALGD